MESSIRSRGPMRVCLDTSFVIEVVREHSRSKKRQDVLKCLYDLTRGGNGPEVYFPQPALGEAISVLLRDADLRDLMGYIKRLVDNLHELRVKVTPITWSALELVRELQEHDEWLEPTDALIMGIALADNECDRLLTLDRKMAESLAVGRVLQRLREKGAGERDLKIGLEC
ncbi:MAG: type II toxin-antitoxin system VapC family toxin [Conexivisphaera sp.]